MTQLPGTAAYDLEPCGAHMATESFWHHGGKSSHHPLAVLNGPVSHALTSTVRATQTHLLNK